MICSLSSIPPLCIYLPPPQITQQKNTSKASIKPKLETLIYKFNSPFELKQLHALLIKTETPITNIPLSRVASVCALTPSFQYAQQIFDQFDRPGIYIWNCCLRDFADSDTPIDAISLFSQLREHDLLPDSFACSFVLKACVQLLDVFHGKIVHALVEKLGFQSNLVLCNGILNLYGSCGDMSDAVLLFDKMPQPDVVSWNTMITQFIKRGDLDSAYNMFVRMPERNVRSWTAIITGFVQCGKPRGAIEIFTKMEEAGFEPNEVTVVAVLSACADFGALDLGRRIHKYSNKNGFGKNTHICNTLIDMYIKCGCLESAREVFYDMKELTVVSWSAMIRGLAIHGQGKEALELFWRMIRTGVKPNGVTFIGLLQACAHMGLVNEGLAFFSSMSQDYKITPSIEHYGTIVDLLSRAGLLNDAQEFINKMPIKPNSIIWGALLGGCKLYKNVELAEIAMENLVELDPLNDGYYVILANIYSEAKQWEKAAKVRKLMAKKGVKKTVGWSSINVKEVVHEFVAGDESHPQIEAIFKKWDELLFDLRLKGYVPNTSVILLDVEEEEKEKFLFRHSEKLALSFGLINSKHGETIRIFKNLRVCEDCHEFFKLISGIVGREIVVRDRNRFHSFRDGACSCLDYW